MTEANDQDDDNAPAEMDEKTKVWIEKIFKSSAAEAGGVVRRSKESVLKHASLEDLRDYIYDKSFHLLETSDQFIIICNTDHVKLHC